MPQKEIVQFKVGQTYGEPIQLISRKDDDRINNAVDEFNDYLTDANKQEKDMIVSPSSLSFCFGRCLKA